MDQALTYHQLTGFSDNMQKASHDDQHNLCLVRAFFCLISGISLDLHADVPQMTVISQSPAPQLLEMSQNSQHDNQI